MNINPLSVVKFAASLVVGVGTGKIVSAAIKSVVKPEKMIDKVAIAAATWVISGIATEATKKYTDDMIDNVAKTVGVAIDVVKVNRINKGTSTFEKEGLDPSRFQKNENNIWVFSDSPQQGESLPPEFDLKGWVRDETGKGWMKKSVSGKTWVLSVNPGTDKWELSERD